MPSLETETDTNSKLESLHHAMIEAKAAGNTSKYNALVSEYNALIESLEAVDVDTVFDAISSDSPSENHSQNQNQKQRHIGILNILHGIVSNCAKGKYSESDKIFLIAELTACISQLEQIDATAAQQEKKRRVKKYSSFNDRL